jgi:prophage antirepressor-like protein
MNNKIRLSMDMIKDMYICGFKIPIYGSKEEPLFLAVDVARTIDYSNGNTNRMLDCVDDNEKVLVMVYREESHQRKNGKSVRYTTRDMWFLTEYGLYEVLFQSRKPIAKQFKSAVKDILYNLRHQHEEEYGDWMEYDQDITDYEQDAIRRERLGLHELTFEEFMDNT